MDWKKFRLTTQLELKSEIEAIIKKLLDMKKLTRVGEGRGVKYKIKS